MRCNHYYCETQYFKHSWLMKLIVFVDGVIVIFFLYIMYQQLILGRPFGNHPMSNSALIISGSIVISISLLVLIMLYHMTLTIEVREDGIYFKFHPIHRNFRKIAWNEIENVEVITYGIFKYGMGIHFGPGWRAYTLGGPEAVKIRRKEGPAIILSSIRPHEFMDILKSLLPDLFK